MINQKQIKYYLEILKKRYEKNALGAVERPCHKISKVDKKQGVITLSESPNKLVWSEEIEDIHWLINCLENELEKNK